MRRTEDLSGVSDADLRAWEPLVRSLTWPFRRQNWAGDLEQEIRLAIARALASWNGNSGAARTTWVHWKARWARAEFLGTVHRCEERISELPLFEEVLGGLDFERQADARLEVARLMGTLTPKQRQAVVLTVLRGYSDAEVARMGLAPSEYAVRSRRFQAMQAMSRVGGR